MLTEIYGFTKMEQIKKKGSRFFKLIIFFFFLTYFTLSQMKHVLAIHTIALNWLFPNQLNRWKSTHSAQVGVGVQGGSGLWSPPLKSVSEYLILVYSRPLILLF